MRSGALRSLRRCTPRSRTSASTSARVVCDRSTCPPWPTAAIRAPLCTSRPTYPSSVSRGSPVCSPIRTRIGPSASARWPSAAAATAFDARAKATKNASPCVSTSTPSWSANAARSRRRCSCSAVPVAVAELVQQPRRALHVREQQRHDAGREIAHHPHTIMERRRSAVQRAQPERALRMAARCGSTRG